MRNITRAAGLLLPICVHVALFAQIEIGSPRHNGFPPADNAQTAPPEIAPGTGVISGRVVNAKTKEPIKKAQVSLSGPANLSAVTDGSGTFTFRALPPGGYMVAASHENFYINQSGFNMPQQLMLAEGEQKQGSEITLSPGATITGRVLDEDEIPVPQCFVAALRTARLQGRTRWQSNNGANTNDQGEYRLQNLQGGRYLLKVNCQATFPAPHGFMPRNDPMIPHEGYAPAFSGQGDPAAITSGLLVSAGAELTGVDFHVRRVPIFVVRGVLSGIDSSTLPNAQVILTPASSSGSPAAADEFTGGNYDPGHKRFTFRRVPAGSYEVTASIVTSESAYFARQTLEVGKTQITEFDLKLSPGSHVSGTLEIDDPNQRFDNMQISLQPVDNNFRGSMPLTTLGPGGAFEFRNVLPGHFRLNPVPIGYLKSVTWAGRAINPQDFEITEGATGPLQISVGSKMAKIEVDLTQRPAPGQLVAGILISDDKSIVFDGRNIAISGPSGELSFQNVPPGKFHVLVLPTANVWSLSDQELSLQLLESHAVAVEVAEGDDKHVTATLVSADDWQKAADAMQ